MRSTKRKPLDAERHAPLRSPIVSADPELLARFDLSEATVSAISTGLINKTYRLDLPDGRVFALQAVSPIFAPAVHEDIEAVTEHLEKKGLETPRLVRTVAGELYATHGGEIWRVLTWIDGVTLDRVRAPEDALRAASLLGGFHRALADLQHAFKARRLGVHDTSKHLAHLRESLHACADHRLYADVAAIAEEIFEKAADLPDSSSISERVVHGDPKISNVIFDRETGAARALVDLDTVAPMHLPLELGDALRSWCNPAGEDQNAVRFSLPIYTAAITGYASSVSGFITPEEVALIVPATATIMVELAARFAADALREKYFGWDPRRFATRGEHNLLRARGQLALARDFAAQRAGAERILQAAFDP